MSVTSKVRSWLRVTSPRPSVRRPVRLGIEALEDRAVPALNIIPVTPQVALTLTVTSVADSGPGTLREALTIANANPGTADTIVFAPQLKGANIDLSTIDSNKYGPSALDVSGPVTIIGSGQTIEPKPFSPTDISGPGAFRLFAVEPKAILNLQNLTLANGVAKGGTGYNGGGGGGGAGLGGAVYNVGELDLIGCTLTGNSAVGGNARMVNGAYGYGGGGGLGGSADANGGGGGPNGGLAPAYAQGTDAYGYPVTLLAKPATNGGFGGGGATGAFIADLKEQQSAANGRAGGFGGGGGVGGTYSSYTFDPINPQDKPFLELISGQGGNGGFGGGGGAGYSSSGPGAGSDFGGGAGCVAGLASLGFIGSGGGGAGLGGAVFNQGGVVKAVNSTFALNTVKGGDSFSAKTGWSSIDTPLSFYYPPGDGGSAYGAGLFNLDGDMTLVNCTVASNDAVAGKGANAGFAAGTAVYNASHDAGLPKPSQGPVVELNDDGLQKNPPPPASNQGANLNLFNNILIGAAGKSAVYNFGDPNGNAQVDGAFNLLSSAVVDVGGAVTTAGYNVGNIQLGPLQNNGGLTPTMMPPATTPLGSTFYFNSLNLPGGVPAFDQRGVGFDRVVNQHINLGAVQVQATRVAVPPGRSIPALDKVFRGATLNAHLVQQLLSDPAFVDWLFAWSRR